MVLFQHDAVLADSNQAIVAGCVCKPGCTICNRNGPHCSLDPALNLRAGGLQRRYQGGEPMAPQGQSSEGNALASTLQPVPLRQLNCVHRLVKSRR